jgi:ABC-2 type transport system ATP-binding protein
MIRVENLVKRFGAITAVDQISFEVGKGEIFAFLGPNGASEQRLSEFHISGRSSMRLC